MDDLARITEDDQVQAQRREARKFLLAIAGDVAAYHAALGDTMSDELRDQLTADFGGKWHSYQLDGVETEIELSLLYGDGDDV